MKKIPININQYVVSIKVEAVMQLVCHSETVEEAKKDALQYGRHNYPTADIRILSIDASPEGASS